MTKIKEKTLHSLPNAFHFNILQTFNDRLKDVTLENERFTQMKQEMRQRFVREDTAYKQSLKQFSTDTISDLDKERDEYANAIRRVAEVWKGLSDETLNIHGRRVCQVYTDFNFRASEALLAENAKLKNMQQVFQTDYQIELAFKAMGLTELNKLLKEKSERIEQLMSARNASKSYYLVGELREARLACDEQYKALVTLINALIEVGADGGQLEEMARIYNEDLKKLEAQLAQSRKRGAKKDDEPADSTDGESVTDTDTAQDKEE